MPEILLLDGGLGTTLESPPFNIQFTPETPLWSSHLLISDPSTLQAAHRAFLDAGADILLTATYQTSIEGFTRTNPSYTPQDAARYMRSAISLARRAISSSAATAAAEERERPSRPCRVALSLGPYGATITPIAAEYTGLYPPEMDGEEALRGWHARRLRVFVDDDDDDDDGCLTGDVDYVAFETLRRADEVLAVRGAMYDVLRGRANSKPWWVCGVFPTEEVDEDDVRRWVDAAVGARPGLPRPWGIGVNCTRIEHVAKIASIMQDQVRLLSEGREDGFVDEWSTTSGKPWLVLYPDGTKGERYDPATKTWVMPTTCVAHDVVSWDETCWEVAQSLLEGDWEGTVIGGCCRAGPAEIAALRSRIDSGR